MARRNGKTWSAAVGWVSVKPTESRDYSDYEDAFWCFLIWVFRWFPDKACDLMRSYEADFANE